MNVRKPAVNVLYAWPIDLDHVPLARGFGRAAFRRFGVERFLTVALIDALGRLIKLVEGDPAKFATVPSFR